MNQFFDIDLYSDVSIDSTSSNDLGRPRNSMVDSPEDILVNFNSRSCLSNLVDVSHRPFPESSCSGHVSEDFYKDQFDMNFNGTYGDEVDLSTSENYLSQMPEELQISDQVGFDRRNRAAMEAFAARRLLMEAQSTRRYAKLLDEVAARKEELLVQLKRNRSLSHEELQLESQMLGNGRSPVRRSFCKSSKLFYRMYEHLRGFNIERPPDQEDQKYHQQKEPLNEDQNRKRRMCRHFLKGLCKRGGKCDFLRDSSIFCSENQKVFFGGLPTNISGVSLREQLEELGYTVINKPKVLRCFSPQVWLGSAKEAQRMNEMDKLVIDGRCVDVRPYESFMEGNMEKRLPDDKNRSVFLGGLPKGTTGQMIKQELEKLSVRVVNHPPVKTGFAPRVKLGNVEQAQKLINMKKVRINEKLVDVRPYVYYGDRSSFDNLIKKKE